MLNKYIVFLMLALMSFGLGLYNPSQQISEVLRTPSSVEILSVNDYNNLPCPSPEESQRLVDLVHLNTEGQELNCSTEHIGKILKLLYFIEKLKINIPAQWGGIHRPVLLDPITHISKSTPALEIDLHQLTKIASNNAGKKIYLGAQFFDLPPLRAMSVLIHENQHSVPGDPGHERCRTGDIPKTVGGCDLKLSFEKNAGAYSTGVFFSIGLGLYGEKISLEDRDFLINIALAEITSRFNFVPETLAVPLDILFVLKENNRIFQVHPFTFDLIPVNLGRTFDQQNITRIQYDPMSRGLVIFTDQGKMYSVDNHRQLETYYPELLDSQLFYVESTKVYIPTGPMGQYAYTFFVTKDGDLMFKEIEVQSGKGLLKKFKSRPPFLTKKIINGNQFSTFLLSTEGSLHEVVLSRAPSPTNTYKKYSSFTHPTIKWNDVTGGATYDELIGVGEDGKIYFENFPKGMGSASEIQASDFKTESPALKYQEGLNIKVALTDSEELAVWNYARSTDKPWKLPLQGIKDFAIGRSYATNEHIIPSQRKPTGWSKNCFIENLFFEPWTGQNFGVNTKGVLTFPEYGSVSCSLYPLPSSLEPTPVVISGSETFADFNSFSQTYLMLQKTDQEFIKLGPYHLPDADHTAHP